VARHSLITLVIAAAVVAALTGTSAAHDYYVKPDPGACSTRR